MSELPTCTVHLWIDGPDVCMQVTTMRDDWRGKWELTASGANPPVLSTGFPQILRDSVSLRGDCPDRDLDIARCPGDTAFLDRIAASIQSIGGVVHRCEPGMNKPDEPAPAADQIAERREYRIQIDDVNSVDTRGIRFDIDLRLTSAELAELVASLIRKG